MTDRDEQFAIRNPQSAIEESGRGRPRSQEKSISNLKSQISNPISAFRIPHSALHLGVVAYLNMQPLIYGLEEAYPASELELCLGSPSALADGLEQGRIDLGMVPVAALFAHPEWRVAGGTMIGSRGPVLSVLLAGGGPPETWRALRPDGNSLTSNALAAILTRRALGLALEPGAPLPPDLEEFTAPAPGEAMVLIGSRALAWRDRLLDDQSLYVIDLGELWTRWTGLPLVCAVWAARPGVDLGAWPERLERQRALNAGRLDEIARAWPDLAHDRLTPEAAKRYLSENIDFQLDGAARLGLERFHEEGRALGLFGADWQWNEALD